MMKCVVAPAVLGFVLAVAVPGYAQPAWGVIGGFNSATLSDFDDAIREDDDVVNAGRRTGFKAGVFFTIPVATALSVQPAVVYTQAGATVDVPEQDGFGLDATVKIDYVTVPIPIRYDFGSGGIKPFVFVGPYMAFKTSAKTNWDFRIDPSFIDTPAEREDVEEFLQEVFGVGIDGGDADLEDVSSTDFGIVIGGGVQLGAIGIGADFSMGFKNVFTDDADVNQDASVKNKMFSVFVSFGFGGN
jgi:Outer membrane protein beta-barrel domain